MKISTLAKANGVIHGACLVLNITSPLIAQSRNDQEFLSSLVSSCLLGGALGAALVRSNPRMVIPLTLVSTGLNMINITSYVSRRWRE